MWASRVRTACSYAARQLKKGGCCDSLEGCFGAARQSKTANRQSELLLYAQPEPALGQTPFKRLSISLIPDLPLRSKVGSYQSWLPLCIVTTKLQVRLVCCLLVIRTSNHARKMTPGLVSSRQVDVVPCATHYVSKFDVRCLQLEIITCTILKLNPPPCPVALWHVLVADDWC